MTQQMRKRHSQAVRGRRNGEKRTRRGCGAELQRIDEPLVQYNSASVGASYRRYLHADHQGSIIAHSDSAGAMPIRNAYDPYGIPSTVNPTNDGRFGFTGQAWLKELGLNYYKARMYSPKLGRFLQTDPIFYRDDSNLYAYVGNDPQNNKDSTGTKCEGPYTFGMIADVHIHKAGAEGFSGWSYARGGHLEISRSGDIAMNVIRESDGYVFRAGDRAGWFFNTTAYLNAVNGGTYVDARQFIRRIR